MDETTRAALEGATMDGYKIGIRHALTIIDTVADDETLATVPIPKALVAIMAIIRQQSETFIAGRRRR
jgi:hypothetical protein